MEETVNTISEKRKLWERKPYWRGPFDLGKTLFLFLQPTAAVFAAGLCLWYSGFQWVDLAVFLLMYSLTGISVTAGYHRLFSHQTYECHPVVKWFFLLFGAASLEQPIINWASDHRYHHRFVDTPSDPYNINQGFFYAHMAWMFHGEPPERSFENVKDLMRDPAIRFQQKYYWMLFLAVSVGIPVGIGFAFGRPLEAFVWGVLVRIAWVHHATWLINSAAHTFGRKPYSLRETARDNGIISLFSFGEGYHNFHHAFASDYRNGVRWYQWDPSKWLIWTLGKLNLASKIKQVPAEVILKAQVQTREEELERLVGGATLPSWSMKMREAVRDLQEQMMHAQEEWQVCVKNYQIWKRSIKTPTMPEMHWPQMDLKAEREKFKRQIRERREKFYELMRQYRETARLFQRMAMGSAAIK